MKMPATSENTSPIVPVESPLAVSSSGASRLTTPSTKPDTNISSSAPQITRLCATTATTRRSEAASIACGVPSPTKHRPRVTTAVSTAITRYAASIEKCSAV